MTDDGRVIAIDVAILVPDEVAGPAREINRALAGDAVGVLRLDDSHLPHVTLAQQFVQRAQLPDVLRALDRILGHQQALRLRVSGIGARSGTGVPPVGDSVWLAIAPSPALRRLHELVMDTLEPFAAPEGGPDAFAALGETVRPRDVEWVRSYREQAAYGLYVPHVSVGHGASFPPLLPIDFTATRLAVCQLGRFCTCRTVLREWTRAS